MEEIPYMKIAATFFSDVIGYTPGSKFDVVGLVAADQIKLIQVTKSDGTTYKRLALNLSGPFDCSYELV